jgi:uncharacterized protein (TIGR02246 family)
MKTGVRLNLSVALLKARRSHCSPARLFSIAVLLAIAMGAPRLVAQDSQARKEIDAFNQEYTAAHLKMDNAAVISMWAEDGVTLLPGMEPLSGRTNIAKWLDDITARMPGYRVVKQQNDFHDILISGDWASEWATTYQITQPPAGKAPIEIHGKILLVLHREQDGKWRIKQEMWNTGPAGMKAEAGSTK